MRTVCAYTYMRLQKNVNVQNWIQAAASYFYMNSCSLTDCVSQKNDENDIGPLIHMSTIKLA